jgi:hypothetical protein
MLGPMRTTALAVGALLALAGGVWVAQGFNLPFAPGSFMTGDPTWIVLGVVAVIGGLGLAAWGWRKA